MSWDPYTEDVLDYLPRQLRHNGRLPCPGSATHFKLIKDNVGVASVCLLIVRRTTVGEGHLRKVIISFAC